MRCKAVVKKLKPGSITRLIAKCTYNSASCLRQSTATYSISLFPLTPVAALRTRIYH